ncbi:MAG: folate-binding protein YgfZ [Deltaproteobacteria bacterium]|nr:folate-binding protein YgfZ [Deltaproteobacteria bacterium]
MSFNSSQWFRAPEKKIRVIGKDARVFLNRVLTQDCLTLKVGEGAYTFQCNSKGRVLSFFYLYLLKDEEVWIFCEPSLLSRILSISNFIILEDVRFEEALDDLGVVLGSKTQISNDGVLPTTCVQINRDRWASECLEVWGPSSDINHWVMRFPKEDELSQDALSILRIQSQTPTYGVDVTEENFPQETNFLKALNFNKGCYIGQEIIARIHFRGHVNKKLTLFEIQHHEIPRHGTPILYEGKEVGQVTSATFSSKIHGVIALGYIQTAHDRKDVIFSIANQPAHKCVEAIGDYKGSSAW